MTVNVTSDVQPVVRLYVIVAVPPRTPFTTPVKEPIVAMAVLLLLQCPPVGVSLSVKEVPEQITPVPAAMGAGSGSTVTAFVR